MPTPATFPLQPVLAASVPGGRLGPTIAALVGLAAVVVGWRAYRRRAHPPIRPTTVVGMGLATVVAGATFLLLADDGPGSGNGVVGSSAAVVLGLVATLLGALARARRQEPVT